MFNKEEVRQQIIQYFRSVGSGENIIQAIKQALFLNENFSPLVLFQLISQGKQKITREDWKRYLIERNISFSDEQIRYFFRHNHFKHEITLNQFLEAMIPYNADVIRQFKAKYLDSLEIKELDSEVQFIFAQLLSNWIGFFRNLIKIRSELSRVVSRRQIQHLIKEDLVLHSKPRQARKFHQSFQQRNFMLAFHQLRKFLELWVSSKQLLHQFCLLNVKRHIKCQNPFQKIVYRHKKQKRSGSRSVSASRSVSRRKSPDSKRGGPSSTDKKRRKEKDPNAQRGNQYSEDQEQDYSNYVKKQKLQQENVSRTKYDQYKRQLKNALQKEVGASIYDNLERKNVNRERQEKRYDDRYRGDDSDRYRKNIAEQNFKNETVQKNFKYQESKQKQKKQQKQFYAQKPVKTYQKNNEGQLIVKFFEQIVLKQDRLQKLRKQLAKSNDFNIINLFKLIDNSNKGFVTKSALENFVELSNPSFSSLVDFYSREKDKLRLQQFSIIFRPLSKQLNQALDKRPQHKVPNPFKKQTMRLIIQIIRLEAEMHENLNTIKNQIRRAGVNTKSLFEYIDLDSQGFITSQNIRQLLEENNINCEAKDLKCLMKLFHKKIDERISLKQFLTFVDF